MKTQLYLTAVGILLSGITAGFGQPVITQDPQSATNVVGTTATFTVAATGTAPLAYQWQRDTGFLNFYDLAGCTNATLVLTNLRASDGVNYRVVITNMDGAVTSAVAHLTILVPPKITPWVLLQHQAVDIGTRASFTATASGTAPLAYQWRLDGHELAGQTNRTLTFSAVQPADEGDYTVVVTNLARAVTSAPVRLWVTPPASAAVKGNFTNSLGRLPYWYLLPTNYDATRSYPLFIRFHGTPGDETGVTVGPPGFKTVASYRQQQRDPVILLWPTRRAGEDSWTDAYLRQTAALLDQFIPRFNVNPNRIYVWGSSEGVHAAWDFIAMRRDFFAGTLLSAGWQGNSPAAAVKEVPVWAWVAQDDAAGQWGATQQAVRTLRLAGGKVCYTEYATGAYAGAPSTHAAGIVMGFVTPAIVDWLLAQRRGVPSMAEPLLTITNPTAQVVWPTGATKLALGGSALALDQAVTRVAWENTANGRTGVATGSNAWSVTGIPLTANRTNVVIVTGTTTSWAPACGGNTTFNETLMVVGH